MAISFTHAAASDDSRHQDGRFNSLALVTLGYDNAGRLQGELQNILRESEIKSEFKWSKLSSARDRFVAEKMIDFAFKNNRQIRIDILIWDLEDQRHKGRIGRDDKENLVRMYYHLTSTTLSKRWPIEGSYWKWRPDEQSSVDWGTLQDCIRNKRRRCVEDLFHNNPEFEKVNLTELVPSQSCQHPLIQLADLFAGMGAYSWGHYDRFKQWKVRRIQQMGLFSQEKLSFSNREKERFATILNFNAKCKQNNLQIAFESTKGFKSHNPKNFINFWLYQPQHVLDKAPTRL